MSIVKIVFFGEPKVEESSLVNQLVNFLEQLEVNKYKGPVAQLVRAVDS